MKLKLIIFISLVLTTKNYAMENDEKEGRTTINQLFVAEYNKIREQIRSQRLLSPEDVQFLETVLSNLIKEKAKQGNSNT